MFHSRSFFDTELYFYAQSLAIRYEWEFGGPIAGRGFYEELLSLEYPAGQDA
jgi:hypothetical protein